MKITDLEILLLQNIPVTPPLSVAPPESWLTSKVVYRDLPGPVNGWVSLSERPGLGLELNDDAVKEYQAT